MSLVMPDVEGSTAPWDWNSHVMNMALQLHHQTLRNLLPQFFAYQVKGHCGLILQAVWKVLHPNC